VKVKANLMRINKYLLSRDGYILIAMVLVAILIRLPVMSFRGYYADLSLYINWGTAANQHLSSMYTTLSTTRNAGNGGFSGGGFIGGFGGGFGAINYPPGMPYVFGAVVYLYNHFLTQLNHVSLESIIRSNGIGPFVAKIPLLLADVALIIFLFVKARERHSRKFTSLAIASLAFSPALLYNGVVWGQTDVLASLPVIVAIFAIISEQYIIGGVSIALAVLLKPQPVIFLPLVLVYMYRWTNTRKLTKFCIAGLITGLLLLLPILVPHFQLMDMFKNMQAESYNDNSSLTSYAFNFWWLMGYQNQTIGSTFMGIKSGIVGDLLFGLVTLVCCIQIWRHREPVYLFFGMAIEIFGFFMFMGGQHERYLFMFIPLALASIIVVKRKGANHLTALYVIGTGLCFLNMCMTVSSGMAGANGQIIPFLSLQSLSDYFSTNLDSLGQSIAFFHLVAFLYALSVYLNHNFEPLEQLEPADSPIAQAEIAESPNLQIG
jgi:Glycosyltransferase family 87